MSAIMSDRLTPAQPVSPLLNSPTSTPQTDAHLTTTTTITSRAESDVSEPSLSNQATPNSPFETTTNQSNSNSVVLPHTAPQARDRKNSVNTSANSTTTTSNLTKKNSISETENSAMPLDNGALFSNDTLAFDYSVLIEDLNDTREMYVQASQALEAADNQIDHQMGEMFGSQYHQSKSVMRARTWAQMGYAESQFILGVHYENGSGVKQDYIEAETLYRQAAKQGHAGAMRQLGMMYEYGNGVKKDTAYSVTWYQKAASHDDAHAQTKFGLMLMNGHGVNKDEAMAVSWYHKAAEKDHRPAQEELAAAYRAGLGVKKDDKLATYWVLKSSFKDGVADLDTTRFLDLLDFIPCTLKDFSEFKNLTTISISSLLIETENFISIANLIRANTYLQVINLSQCIISDRSALLLIKALENNTTLTLLNINPALIDVSLYATIKTMLAQNITIAELRKYVKNYFIKNSNHLPLEVLDMIIDRTIVAYIKSGQSKESTQKAIDELMLNSTI